MMTHTEMKRSHLYVIGYGEEFPVAPNHTQEGRTVNRRVDFRFMPAGPPSPPINALPDKKNGPTRTLTQVRIIVGSACPGLTDTSKGESKIMRRLF